MNRPGFERIKRRTHIRLSLEHLEHRRLMAGLNVLVYTDQDGSRSLSPAMDTPAPNRLVYVDLNRNLQFEDGEPLAASGDDGYARFPGLAAGDYLIGLAANNAAQLLTTSVVPDANAQTVSPAPGAPLTSIIASTDLKHGWSATSNGLLTPIGADDSGRASLNLNGRLLSVTSGDDSTAWALVDQGQAQPTLFQLDYKTGSARVNAVQGLSNSQHMSALVRTGNTVYVQLAGSDTNFVAALQTTDTGVSVGQPVAIPNGTVVGSSVTNRLAVFGSRSQFSGEDQELGSKISLVQLRGETASIESVKVASAVAGLNLSTDGKLLFASLKGGGVEVYSTVNGLKSAAELAEAAGPVSAGSDGRFVTTNASKQDELIVWDSTTWTPAGRVQLPTGQGAIASLAVDKYGDRVLVATRAATLSARLANPAPQSVAVPVTGVSQASLGVRLIDRPVPLPSRIEVSQSTDEDVPLSLDLSSSEAIRGLGTSLFFAPGTGTALGTLLVTPSGRVTYRAQANINGSDNATLRVFDGISTTTLVISLDVRPVNDAPSAFTADPIAVAEAAPAGSVAGFATVFDVDSDAHYEITTNDARFIVVDGQIMLSQSAVLDYESESSIDLEITATDMDNPAFVITRRISIPVQDSNDAPTSVGLSGNTIVENGEQSSVGRVNVVDPDEHGQYSYAVSDDRFEISGGLLRLRSGVMLDHETEPVISLSVTVIDPTVDGSNDRVTSKVDIYVLDGNDAPTGLSISANQLKSGETGAIAGRINVTDPDGIDSYSYGVSDARFIVDGSVLRLRDGQAVYRDQEATVSMMITVTDSGGGVLSETVTLNVINDAPYQNSRDPYDVDGDGNVFARDALILVNRLNQKGSHVLTPSTASGEGDSGQIYFLDVNGDGILSPIDALLLINHLNQRATPAVNNSGSGNNSGTNSGSGSTSGNGSGGHSQLPDDVDPVVVDHPNSQLPPEGEANDEPWGACQPWLAGSSLQEQNRRDEIDSELELLVDELSRARVG